MAGVGSVTDVMVSVIIPTYNRGGWLREAIVSVLSQSEPPGEIIVVDDGSEDDTAVVVERFSPRVKLVRRSHGGVSAARNAGIRASSGRWLAFLDSDDLWLPGKLGTQMDFLANNPRFLICQTEEIWIRNGKRLNPRHYHRKPDGECFERLLERCLVSPSAVVMERALLEDVGFFDEEMTACEDYDLWLRIGCSHPIGFVTEPLVIKRGGHSDQLSGTVPSLDRFRIQSLAKLLKSGRLTSVQAEQTLNMLRRKCRIYGEGCRKRENMAEVRRVEALLQGISGEIRTRNTWGVGGPQ
jgi:glycosyltransferase involved in cell wall biosynthesis